MQTILVPLDGSTLAEHALPYARLYARLYDADVTLLTVIGEYAEFAVASDVRMRAIEHGDDRDAQDARILHALAAQRRYAEEYLAGRAATLQAEGLRVTVTVETGNPAAAILATAGTTTGAMIIMATHGYTGLRRWALGSVTEKVVQQAPGPVLVIRSTDTPIAADVQLERILVPLDLSEHAAAALPVAIDLAERVLQADLFMLHANVPLAQLYAEPYMPVIELEAARRQEALVELTRLADQYRTTRIRTHVITKTGYPAETIITEAGHHAVNVIVMATHGWSGFTRWVLGSVARKVLEGSHTPLLLVRPPPQPRGEPVDGPAVNSTHTAV